MNKHYLDYMHNLLQDEFDDYLASLDTPLHKGLNINTFKIDKQQFIDKCNIDITPSKFDEDSFYYNPNLKLGNTVEHHLGLFYIQEPSASSAVTVLNPLEGSIVGDLCSAPGGKMFQLSKKVGNAGLVICNEYESNRYQILLSNIERLGLSNVIACNLDTKQMAKYLNNYFDYLLVDAPCSGEGMIKKHDIALREWSLNNAKYCNRRQIMILENAYGMLKNNGRLVYSTCTYNRIENEDVVEEILANYDGLKSDEIKVNFAKSGFIEGDRKSVV